MIKKSHETRTNCPSEMINKETDNKAKRNGDNNEIEDGGRNRKTVTLLSAPS